MRGGVALACACFVVAALGIAAPASAGIDTLQDACVKRDAADDDTQNGNQLPYSFCDDGLAFGGGTTPNPGANRAIAVPAAYTGAGQPDKDAAAANAVPGQSGGDIAIDADLTLPDPARSKMPKAGYPLVVMMHGCCAGDRTGWEARTIDAGGEKWHYSNAWFASRGYAVLTYTSRGFVNADGRGSTGQNQLDSSRFEINDYQHLAGQLADDADLDPKSAGSQRINPKAIVATGGSYGGGFSWLAFVDPTWKSPGGKQMKLVAAAPKYGWTNLIEALIPNGIERRDALPTTNLEAAGRPIGVPKRSILLGLYASGAIGLPPPAAHSAFPSSVDRAIVCLQASEPIETSPLCTDSLRDTLPEFLRDRSAYFANGFFDRIRSDKSARAAVFSAGTFTDPLFPPSEHRRMVERLKSVVPDYPVQEYYGDYQHFVQNKATDWGDLCGPAPHLCRYGEYPEGDLDATPERFQRLGITTRLNRFVDHYAKPPANPKAPRPDFDVTASLQVCPQTGSAAFPSAEPGQRFTADSFKDLAPSSLKLESSGSPQTTTNVAAPNFHAVNADPLLNQTLNGSRCVVENSSAGPGVATYDFGPLSGDAVMIGRTRVTVRHTGGGSNLQLNARLYDVLPNGSAVLVDRGGIVVGSPNATTVLDLRGNGWRFERGHRIRLELAQDDEPHMKRSLSPSALTLAGVSLDLPVRETGPTSVVRAPVLASEVSRSATFGVAALPRSGERAGVGRFEIEVRAPGKRKYSTARGSASGDGHGTVAGKPGKTYALRARAIDRRGPAGPYAYGKATVPFDERSGDRTPDFDGDWSRVSSRQAFLGTVASASERSARMSLRVRGSRVYLIGRRDRNGGKALLRVGSRKRTVSFYSRKPVDRVVIASLRANAKRSTAVELQPLAKRASKNGGQSAYVDAIGAVP